MTERTGGSDVGRTETSARHESRPLVSSLRHQMVHLGDHLPNDDDARAGSRMRLANRSAGSRGLSLFYLENATPAGARITSSSIA